MSKRQDHKRDLAPLLGDPAALRAYLLANSNLPGRRGNLELAAAFADLAGERSAARESLWALCLDLASISAAEAPVNSAQEFIPFCGTLAIGALGAADPACTAGAWHVLRRVARDPRWRTREAVAQGLQRLIPARGPAAWAALAEWVAAGHPLEMRAAAAGVAEPALLQDPEPARAALDLHRAIFAQLRQMEDRRSEDFRVLRQALGYTVSVVVAALPEEGFEWLAALARERDADLRWIVKQNLRKNRLVRRFPARVGAIAREIE